MLDLKTLCFMLIFIFESIGQLKIYKGVIPSQIIQGCTPVSYTHLDVYKRQVYEITLKTPKSLQIKSESESVLSSLSLLISASTLIFLLSDKPY